jgi:hypothetical protein
MVCMVCIHRGAGTLQTETGPAGSVQGAEINPSSKLCGEQSCCSHLVQTNILVRITVTMLNVRVSKPTTARACHARAIHAGAYAELALPICLLLRFELLIAVLLLEKCTDLATNLENWITVCV